MNYEALKTELEKPEYQGKTDEQILQMLNAETVEYHVPVSSVDMVTYLSETPSYKATAQAPLSLYNILSLSYRDMSLEPIVRATTEQIIDLGQGVERMLALKKNPAYGQLFGVLIAASLYIESERQGILNQGRRFKNKAVDLGAAVAEQVHLNVMRLQPQIALYEQQLNEAQAKLMLLNQGIDPQTFDPDAEPAQ